MEDYEVSRPGERWQPLERASERHVRMTPLTLPSLDDDYGSEHGAAASYLHQSDYIESDYLSPSRPVSSQRMPPRETPLEVMETLQRLMEDNQRLHRQMRDMHRRLDTHVPARDLPPIRLQSTHHFTSSDLPEQRSVLMSLQEKRTTGHHHHPLWQMRKLTNHYSHNKTQRLDWQRC